MAADPNLPPKLGDSGSDPRSNWWSRRPRWGKWTIGVVAALIILFIGVAIGGSGSKESELKDEIAALNQEQAGVQEQAEDEVGEAEASVLAAERETKAERGKETELVEAGEAKAKKIVGAATAESDQLTGKIQEQEAQLSSVSNEVGSVESKLSGLRGEVGEAKEIAAKSTIPGDGTFQAEVDYIPGTYKSDGPTGGIGCYWATLGSANTNDILDNEDGNGPQIAEISSPYFQTSGCGKWTRVE